MGERKRLRLAKRVDKCLSRVDASIALDPADSAIDLCGREEKPIKRDPTFFPIRYRMSFPEAPPRADDEVLFVDDCLELTSHKTYELFRLVVSYAKQRGKKWTTLRSVATHLWRNRSVGAHAKDQLAALYGICHRSALLNALFVAVTDMMSEMGVEKYKCDAKRDTLLVRPRPLRFLFVPAVSMIMSRSSRKRSHDTISPRGDAGTVKNKKRRHESIFANAIFRVEAEREVARLQRRIARGRVTVEYKTPEDEEKYESDSDSSTTKKRKKKEAKRSMTWRRLQEARETMQSYARQHAGVWISPADVAHYCVTDNDPELGLRLAESTTIRRSVFKNDPSQLSKRLLDVLTRSLDPQKQSVEKDVGGPSDSGTFAALRAANENKDVFFIHDKPRLVLCFPKGFLTKVAVARSDIEAPLASLAAFVSSTPSSSSSSTNTAAEEEQTALSETPPSGAPSASKAERSNVNHIENVSSIPANENASPEQPSSYPTWMRRREPQPYRLACGDERMRNPSGSPSAKTRIDNVAVLTKDEREVIEISDSE